MVETPIIFELRPSLRRAYFFAAIYLIIVSIGRMNLGISVLDPISLVTVGFLGVLLAYAHLVKACTRYQLTEDYLTAFEGVLWRSVTKVPVDRITDTSAHQTLLERILGLATWNANTAGSSSREVTSLRCLISDVKELGAKLTECKERAEIVKTVEVGAGT